MKSLFRRYDLFAVRCAGAAVFCLAATAGSPVLAAEVFLTEPMPSGFRVEATELEGPVFADSNGNTLYSWPQHKLRNGYSGEAAGKPLCYDEVLTVTAGLMSPYPAGIALPDLESRPSCTDLWPPVLAQDGAEEATEDSAEEVGKWSVIPRKDGTRQWAYDEQPLYTSVRDKQPGDTLGGTQRKRDNDAPSVRAPVGPSPLLPPGLAVKRISVGRILTTTGDASVYASAHDTATASACKETCLQHWRPVIAPDLARPQGEWSVLERAFGVRQWVFRGEPLYTYRHDRQSLSQEGSDEPGWHNVFMQGAPAFPASFNRQATLAGEVLADRNGKTIYLYQCGDDSADQLACDHPDDTQVYRLAMCGGGDPVRCQEHWPYVTADEDARSTSRSWSIIAIDPATGRLANEDQSNALRVWAYRDRPVYTFAGDRLPGDVNGGGTGEWRGKRNGLLAFWLRDDYMEHTL